MYIPSQSDDMSSRLTMTSEDQSETKADRLSQPESSVKKRKRLYEAQDSPQRYESSMLKSSVNVI